MTPDTAAAHLQRMEELRKRKEKTWENVQIHPDSEFERGLDGQITRKPPRAPENPLRKFQAKAEESLVGAVDRGIPAALSGAPFPHSMVTNGLIGAGTGAALGPYSPEQRSQAYSEAAGSFAGNVVTGGAGGVLNRLKRVGSEVAGTYLGGGDGTDMALTAGASGAGEALGTLGDRIKAAKGPTGHPDFNPNSAPARRLQNLRDEYMPDQGMGFTVESGIGSKAQELSRIMPGGKNAFYKQAKAMNELGMGVLMSKNILREVPIEGSMRTSSAAEPSIRYIMESLKKRFLMDGPTKIPMAARSQMRDILMVGTNAQGKQTARLGDPGEFLERFTSNNAKDIAATKFIMSQVNEEEKELLKQAFLFEEIIGKALFKSDHGVKVDLRAGQLHMSQNVDLDKEVQGLILSPKQLAANYQSFNTEKAYAIYGAEEWKGLGKVFDALSGYEILQDLDEKSISAPIRYLGNKVVFSAGTGGAQAAPGLANSVAGVPFIFGVGTLINISLMSPKAGKMLTNLLKNGANSLTIDQGLTSFIETVQEESGGRYQPMLVGSWDNPAFVMTDAFGVSDQPSESARERLQRGRAAHRNALSDRRGPQMEAVKGFFDRFRRR